ncbi:hypothetical protein G6021_06510 [Dietzia sp. CW19]|uniref:SipW-dependent-type signal peptide-containing protein n=1 Tax=Dietzia sp. CW19 TaxID=1630634 RepID=UPI0015FC1D65|nr:SipW-dependent-type signal peptide-containing protein [Dietzia sp. CW19]MBB1050782.1 hypothetical protein [Dietzia sp. CW19]
MMSDTALTPAQRRSRKRKALLAGGMVLGLGATMSLAAWSDTEYANGVFSAGQFNVQGNKTTSNLPSGTWADNFTANGAGLEFSANFSNLTPGTTVYAPFSLRIDPLKASYDATVHIESVTSTGDANLLPKLTWKARTGIAPKACAEITQPATYSTSGAALVPSPDATPGPTVNGYTATTTPPTFTLSKTGAPTSTTPVTVCLAVSLASQPTDTPPTDPSWNFASSVTTTWKFSATSA